MKTLYDRQLPSSLPRPYRLNLQFYSAALQPNGRRDPDGRFMAPAAPLPLGQMSSLDCTSDTGGRRPGRYLDDCGSRLPDEERGQGGHARGRRERTAERLLNLFFALLV